MTIGTTRITHGMMPCMIHTNARPEAAYIPINNPREFLRFLHKRRFSDREIADYLNDPPSYLLHEHPHEESPLKLLYEPRPLRIWTRHMVRQYRRKHGLPSARTLRSDMAGLAAIHKAEREIYALRWAQSVQCDLRRSQVDMLDTLYEHGPQTMRQLMRANGWTRLPRLDGGRLAMGQLVTVGAVELLGSTVEDGRVVRLYGLAKGVGPQNERRRLTGVEQTQRKMRLIEDLPGSRHSLTVASAKNYSGSFSSHCSDN